MREIVSLLTLLSPDASGGVPFSRDPQRWNPHPFAQQTSKRNAPLTCCFLCSTGSPPNRPVCKSRLVDIGFRWGCSVWVEAKTRVLLVTGQPDWCRILVRRRRRQQQQQNLQPTSHRWLRWCWSNNACWLCYRQTISGEHGLDGSGLW